MTLARAVKDELKGEGLGMLDRASIAVTIIEESRSSWRVQVFAPGQFFWLSDRWTKESMAREGERAVWSFLAKCDQRRAERRAALARRGWS